MEAEIGYVYFIGDNAEYKRATAIKIGFSIDPHRRLKELQTSHGTQLHLYTYIMATAWCEKRLHAALSADRMNGEWFQPTETVIEIVEDAQRIQATMPLWGTLIFAGRADLHSRSIEGMLGREAFSAARRIYTYSKKRHERIEEETENNIRYASRGRTRYTQKPYRYRSVHDFVRAVLAYKQTRAIDSDEMRRAMCHFADEVRRGCIYDISPNAIAKKAYEYHQHRDWYALSEMDRLDRMRNVADSICPESVVSDRRERRMRDDIAEWDALTDDQQMDLMRQAQASLVPEDGQVYA